MRHVVLIVRNTNKAKKNGRKVKKYETCITENGKFESCVITALFLTPCCNDGENINTWNACHRHYFILNIGSQYLFDNENLFCLFCWCACIKREICKIGRMKNVCLIVCVEGHP